MIIIGAHLFGYVLTLAQITPSFVSWISNLPTSPYVVMAGIIVFYLILGCFMDQMAILILTVPVMTPAIKALGFDPVWFGVLVVVTAEVGMITPPLGMNVFVVARYSGRPLAVVFHGATPHIIAHLRVLALMVAFASLVTWLCVGENAARRRRRAAGGRRNPPARRHALSTSSPGPAGGSTSWSSSPTACASSTPWFCRPIGRSSRSART